MILENNAAVRVLEKRDMERGVKIGEKRSSIQYKLPLQC